MEKKVSDNGNFNEGYGNGARLITWLTDKHVKESIQEKLKGINKDINRQITQAVNAGSRKNALDKLTRMVVMTAKNQNAIKHK
ncbi:hypothetical protein G9396_19410 [Providencia rettgeri]|nr:hypothetical protein G9396_19410 [Providencia rettgeri]